MRVQGFGPETTAGELRALTPPPRNVEADVRALVEEVRSGGDAAVRRLTERFDKAELGPPDLAVPPAEIEAAIGTLEPAVLAGLHTAIGNVRAAAEAQLRLPSTSCRCDEQPPTCPAGGPRTRPRW